MVNELKNQVIVEFEKLFNKMLKGYQVDLTNIIDKIYYIEFISL